jgi:tetratricopeptide (TPR) repeat protein
MRSALPLVLIAALAACGGRAPRPASPAASPATDLASAPTEPTTAGGGDRRTGTGGVTPRQPTVQDLDVVRLEVVGRDARGEPIVEAATPAPLLEKGNAALAAGQQDEALGHYRKLVVDFPESRLAPVALYNVGLVFEARADWTGAIAAYGELVAAYPTGRDSLDAHLRKAALQAEHRLWRDTVVTLDAVVLRSDLTHGDRIEAFARKGYALLEQGDLAGSSQALEAAVAAWRRASRIDDPYFIAMAHYYLGEIAHRQFLAAPLRLPDDQLERDLAAKEQLAVAAYDRWKDALGFKQAYWATASGYRMSQVFVEFWKAAVAAPYPQQMDARAREQYVVEVHARVRHNLEKALDGHRMNVELAKAYGVQTSWSEASKVQAAEILNILAKESRGDLARPAS